MSSDAPCQFGVAEVIVAVLCCVLLGVVSWCYLLGLLLMLCCLLCVVLQFPFPVPTRSSLLCDVCCCRRGGDSGEFFFFLPGVTGRCSCVAVLVDPPSVSS